MIRPWKITVSSDERRLIRWFDELGIEDIPPIGDEIPFNRHFYKYAPPRSLQEIDPAVNSSYFDNYFGLREELKSLLERPVDLLSIDALDNPYFIERIANERETLYAA